MRVEHGFASVAFEIPLPWDGAKYLAVGDADVEYTALPPERDVGVNHWELEAWVTGPVAFNVFDPEGAEITLPEHDQKVMQLTLKKILETAHYDLLLDAAYDDLENNR